MSKMVLGPSSLPLQAVLIERRKIETNPNIDLVDSFTIKEGPKAYKVATHWVIKNQHTGEVNHHSVKIETYRKTKSEWQWDEERSISLDNIGDNDDILRFANFLGTIRNATIPDDPNDYVVIPVNQVSETLGEILRTVTVDDEKADIVAQVLSLATDSPTILQQFVTNIAQDPQAAKRMVAALNMERFASALRALDSFIQSNAPEQNFQYFLQQNPWMFGSEYSTLTPRREWVRGQAVDFMLRRTADDYLEFIEIKRPLNEQQLFVWDASHNTFRPGSDLSAVIGQAMNYIEAIDRNELHILTQDREKVSKVCAKIVIGRSGEEDQVAALRRLNAHLNRIEILTFDQLYRIAERVLSFLEDEQKTPDLPF